MTDYKPYAEVLKRKPDFRVRYRIFSEDEGGRWAPVYQGIQFNYWYDHEEHEKGDHFMIWPEFEDNEGQIIRDKNSPITPSGTARMWIIFDDSIQYHKRKIKPGTKGYMEGEKRVGECEVLELINIG